MAIARKIALRLELCWQSLRIEQYQVTAKDNQRTARKLIVANIGFPRGRRTYIVVRENRNFKRPFGVESEVSNGVRQSLVRSSPAWIGRASAWTYSRRAYRLQRTSCRPNGVIDVRATALQVGAAGVFHISSSRATAAHVPATVHPGPCA